MYYYHYYYYYYYCSIKNRGVDYGLLLCSIYYTIHRNIMVCHLLRNYRVLVKRLTDCPPKLSLITLSPPETTR